MSSWFINVVNGLNRESYRKSLRFDRPGEYTS